MKWISLASLLFINACSDPEFTTHSDGFSYVPIIVTVRVGEFGMTEGVEVRFVNQWSESESTNNNDPIVSAIHESLGEPSLTDSTSSAMVWMRTPDGAGTNPDYYHRSLDGQILVGPEDEPWVRSDLAKIVDPRLRYETSRTPIQVTIQISHEDAGVDAPHRAEQGSAGQPEKRSESIGAFD